PFPITFGDYLASESKESDYTIANIPFNQKKKHCHGVNSALNPKLVAERVKIIENKTSQDIYFLNAEKFSEWQNKQRFLSAENIQQICNKDNWTGANLEKIKEQNYVLVPLRYESEKQAFKLPTEEEKQEIDEKIKATQKELYMLITELDEATNIYREQVKKMDADPDYLLKKDLAFTGEVNLD
ncbi:4121_t:CDS:2, partial [Ambispora leptoticha]